MGLPRVPNGLVSSRRTEFRAWWQALSDLSDADGDGSITRNEHVTIRVGFVTIPK